MEGVNGLPCSGGAALLLINTHHHELIKSKKIDLERDFAAGVYQSLQTGDTVSHVGIFDSAL
jgi:hypothetical protein